MKITYLLGNGFDLNFGLKTSYKDFIDYYIRLPESEFLIINEFKEELRSNIFQWSDFELKLGNALEKYSNYPIEHIIMLLDNIQQSLADYIKMQDVTFTISQTDKLKMYNDLFSPEMYLTNNDRESYLSYKVHSLKAHNIVNIISFNYTKTIEKILDYSNNKIMLGEHNYALGTYSFFLEDIEHIHGDTENNMLIGVNDTTQINSEKLKKDSKIIRSIVKPEMNRCTGTLRDKKCLKYIEESDIICIFGMSLGETDRIWWEQIVNSMAKGRKVLIVFSKEASVRKIDEYKLQGNKESIIEKLLSYSSLSIKKKSAIKKRIFVSINTDMFKVNKIPRRVITAN